MLATIWIFAFKYLTPQTLNLRVDQRFKLFTRHRSTRISVSLFRSFGFVIQIGSQSRPVPNCIVYFSKQTLLDEASIPSVHNIKSVQQLESHRIESSRSGVEGLCQFFVRMSHELTWKRVRTLRRYLSVCRKMRLMGSRLVVRPAYNFVDWYEESRTRERIDVDSIGMLRRNSWIGVRLWKST